MRYFLSIAATVLLLPPLLLGQKPRRNDNGSGYDRAARATVLHAANVYVSADSSAPPITTVTAGHEVVVMARNGPWVNVFANTDAKEDADPDSEPEFKDPAENPDPSSGWIRDKGVVGPGTVNGDAILYGAAADLEAQAAQPHPPQGAAEAAHLLYERVADYFPKSPLAPEAAFRAADIRWQLDKTDVSTLPSAHEQQAYFRPQLYEGALRRVMKLYPDSPVAARAAFDLLDDKLCGDWQGLPKCPEQESDLYLKYAGRYPGGPKSAEALYDAAYRQGALVTMYQVDENGKRSEAAAKNCQSIADELRKDYPTSDYADRAESIAFRVAQGIPIYGNDRE
jgi:outer membrane protein assembly factor BamD (BamD/ComL family)